MEAGIGRLAVISDRPLFQAGLSDLLRQTVGRRIRIDLFNETPDTPLGGGGRAAGQYTICLDVHSATCVGRLAFDTAITPSTRRRTIALISPHCIPEAEQLLRAGTGACVPNDIRPDELAAALRAVSRGEIYVADSLLQAIGRCSLTPGHDALTRLTRREREVFQLLASCHSVAETADRLAISPKTVHVHRANVLRKLSLRRGEELVRFAAEHGLLSNMN